MSLSNIVQSILNKDKEMNPEFASGSATGAIDLHKEPAAGRGLEVESWLPQASKVYDISSNMKDFVMVPVIIMPTDLPNRNSVAFPFEELAAWNPRQGMANFKTWRGKPTFEEHNHNVLEEAKGIVFDTYLAPLSKTHGNIHKVIALCGFDRQKDPNLANAILRGVRKSYSMGAFITTYECAVCGDCSKPNKLNTECGHVVRGQHRTYEVAGKKIPAYLIARNGINGFEVSSVGTPAWSSATNSKFIDMAKL